MSETSLACEYADAPLRDRRLNARLMRIVAALEAHPDLSFPRAMGNDGELEGFYRFVGNEKVTLAELVEPHVRATVERGRAEGEVLVVHDTTDFRFRGEAAREGLGTVNRNDQGFLGHFALALSADGERRPLGVLGVEAWTRDKPTPTMLLKRGQVDYKGARALTSEEARWGRLVETVEATAAASGPLIHLMDSEADNYDLLAKLVGNGRRFVLRLCYDRVLAQPLLPPEAPRKTKAFIAARPVVCERTVRLARRRAGKTKYSKRTPPRAEREATLAFRAAAVTLQRPPYCTASPPTLTLNVVGVTEVDAPAEVEPVEWVLLTTESIATEADVLRIVDYYRARWVVEEYFKALKTGCAFEKRQLESLDSLLRALGIFVPIAWSLLRLRALSRTDPDAPAGTVLTPLQQEVLKRDRRTRTLPQTTARDALLAVARLGGHLRSNGEPGWQTLGFGYNRLLALEEGFRLAIEEM